MWKCVKCEMNNPDSSGSCFICGTEKSYSLRLAEEMKKTADFVKEEPVIHTKPEEDKKSAERSSGAAETVKDDIFGDAVHAYADDTYTEKDSAPEIKSSSPEMRSREEDEYFLYELEREKREKGSKKIKETVLVIVLIILVFSIFIGIYESTSGHETEPETAEPAVYITEESDETGTETTNEKKYIIIKDV